MRKTTKMMLALALTAITGVQVLHAQWRPTVGARAAFEITAPSGGRDIYKNGGGIDLGAVVRLPLPKNFYVEPGAYFVYTGMSSKDLVKFDDKYLYEGAANVYSFRIPLNVGYKYSVTPLIDLDFYTGPWINFNVSARQKLDPNFGAPEIVPDRTIDLFKHGWRHVDGQWGFGLNVTFAKSYTVGLSAGVAFTPLAKYGNGDKKVRIHRNTVAVSLGYNF